MTSTLEPPAAAAETLIVEDAIHRRRWAILAVLCLAVFVTVLDGTIVNVALPTLALELGASTRQLQWIVDAYLLVFTGLLLAAGGLGDRYGRRGVLLIGLVALFAVGWALRRGLRSLFQGALSQLSTSLDSGRK